MSELDFWDLDDDDDEGPQIHFWSVDDDTGEVAGGPLWGPDYGPCCICNRGRQDAVLVRNFIMLSRRAVTPGTGWGCFVCGLPQDGAMAVVCDGCLEGYADGAKMLRFVIDAQTGQCGRVPIEGLSDEPFEHDMSKHPEAELRADDLPDTPYITDDRTCSECAYPIDPDNFDAYDFVADDGGVSPGYDFAPPTHWASGTIGCPRCGVRIPIEVSD